VIKGNGVENNNSKNNKNRYSAVSLCQQSLHWFKSIKANYCAQLLYITTSFKVKA